MSSKSLVEAMLSRSDELLDAYDALEYQLEATSKNLRSFLMESSFSACNAEFHESIEALNSERDSAEAALEEASRSIFDQFSRDGSSGIGAEELDRELESDADRISRSGTDHTSGADRISRSGTDNISVVDHISGVGPLSGSRDSNPRSEATDSGRVAGRRNVREKGRAEHDVSLIAPNRNANGFPIESETDSDGFKKPLPPKRATNKSSDDFAAFIDSLAIDDFLTGSERGSGSSSLDLDSATLGEDDATLGGAHEEGSVRPEGDDDDDDGGEEEEDNFAALDLSFPKTRIIT